MFNADLSIKHGQWGDSESAIYLSYDFFTASTTVLVCGLDLGVSKDTLQTVFSRRTSNPVTPFAVLLHLASDYAQVTEEFRWKTDYRVQEHESRTGYTAVRYPGSSRVPIEDLNLAKDLYATIGLLDNVGRAADLQIDLVQWLLEQHELFSSMYKPGKDHTYKAVESTLQLQKSINYNRLKQIDELRHRIRVQVNVVCLASSLRRS